MRSALPYLVAAALSAGSIGGPAWGGDRPLPPPLSNQRYVEDYSYLRESTNRTGAWWEAFKYLPIGSDGEGYLSFGGELRIRSENYSYTDFGAAPADHYRWYRALPYADLHLGPYLRLFGQAIAAASEGNLQISGVDSTGLEMLQGFAEVTAPATDALTIKARGGRQLLSYGSERLISLRYGPNVLRSFDALVGSLQGAGWCADAFFARPVVNLSGSFNDLYSRDRSVWSLYATVILPSIGKTSGLDLYAIGYENSQATFDQGTGSERRQTFGSRFFGDAAGWDWNFEGILQTGRFAGAPIQAWSVASDTGYTLRGVTFRPRLGLRANIISGDKDALDPSLQTFNALFPKGKYFGEIGLIGPANLINLHPNLTFKFNEQWSAVAAAVFYWRESLGDGVYGNAGNLIRSAGRSSARYIGTQADISIGWQPVRWFSAELSYSVLLPGRFLEETGASATTHFVGIESSIKF